MLGVVHSLTKRDEAMLPSSKKSGRWAATHKQKVIYSSIPSEEATTDASFIAIMVACVYGKGS